jgi:NAD+ synthase (glutamine-hydrolysing)
VVEVEGRDPRGLARGVGVRGTARPSSRIGGAVATAAARLDPEREFLAAETLGLFDYMRKCRASGFVVSLSGGCDSACVTVLVGHMIAAAWQELGPDALLVRLGLSTDAPPQTPRELIKSCLTCVYQATRNSGPVTRAAAHTVAEAVGADFHAVEVQELVDEYARLGTAILGRALAWDRDDLALQNVQARVRSPLVWLVANVRQAILLTTSNRSEAAVGYATMDGDTSGGLAPLGGIDKPFLRAWLRWAETDCAEGLGPLPALAAVNTQAPTAELRPPDEHQTDEGDLMPYDVLERIERYFVRDRLGPDDVLQMLVYDFPQIPVEGLRAYAEKFFVLWARNQWKRERLAPSFHLDDESLDPKTWCRFPILSAPYELTKARRLKP